MATHDVFLPEGVPGVVQQQLFGHEWAVQPDCATENTASCQHASRHGVRSGVDTVTAAVCVCAMWGALTWTAVSSSVSAPSVLSCDLEKSRNNSVQSQNEPLRGAATTSASGRPPRAHLYGSATGNMPGHVGSPGRSGPKKWWDTLSFVPQTNSSSSRNLWKALFGTN